MKDWRRGLIQANRYKVFANRVYLAVPTSIGHVVNKRMLQKHGIGLISFDPNTNKKRVILSPSKSKPSSPSRSNYALEYFWKRGMLNTRGISPAVKALRSFG